MRKKFYVVPVVLLFAALFLFAGCSLIGPSNPLGYLTAQKEFVGNPGRNESYRITLTVNEDTSYALSVSYGTDALRNYSAEGSEIEYLGYEEHHWTSEWMGVTQDNVSYNHVLRLNDATVDLNGSTRTFYIVASSTNKRSDSFMLTLKAYAHDPASGEENLLSIINSSLSFNLQAR